VERYPLGRLAPAGTVIEPETLDEIAEADAPDPGDGDPEPAAPNVASMFPSSIGLATQASSEVTELLVTGTWSVASGPRPNPTPAPASPGAGLRVASGPSSVEQVRGGRVGSWLPPGAVRSGRSG
jgi:hypothetical protein